MAAVAPVVDAEYKKEIEKARRELRALITGKSCASQMLKLAWHDAGTYDAEKKRGGPSGSIKNLKSLNSGLKEAIDLCEDVKKKHPKISYADLYQLAGVVAIEMAGGPPIEFIPGRKDSQESPEEESFLEANQGAKGLRKIFSRMGLNDQDIVALSRVYTFHLRKAHQDKSIFVEARTRDPLKLDNSYFVELQNRFQERQKKEESAMPQTATEEESATPQTATEETQSEAKDEAPVDLPTDEALVEDPKFRFYVNLYAKDEETFLRDYAKSHKKLSELGFTQQSSASKTSTTTHKKPSEPRFPSPSAEPKGPKVTTLGAVGVVIAATVMLLNYMYKRDQVKR